VIWVGFVCDFGLSNALHFQTLAEEVGMRIRVLDAVGTAKLFAVDWSFSDFLPPRPNFHISLNL
jgi:hypothetical protein